MVFQSEDLGGSGSKPVDCGESDVIIDGMFAWDTASLGMWHGSHAGMAVTATAFFLEHFDDTLAFLAWTERECVIEG